MSHLRDLVAALVDGELTAAERDRALAHLAGCAACRSEVAAQRAVKERLAAMAAPAPPPGLLHELRRMAEPGEPLPMTRRASGDLTRPPTVPVGGRPPARPSMSRRTARSRGRRRVHGVLTLSAVAVTTTLVTAFAVGGPSAPATTPVQPDLDSYVVEHARASRVVPFADVPAEVVGISARRNER